MTSVALLGTSADPPTCGHEALLEQLLDHHDRVVTWASDNPGKRHALPLEQRCNLLQTLVQAISNPRLSQVQELSSPWAITTLKRAEALWPGQHLSFVVGSDLAAQIPSWKQSDQWLPHCRLAIAPRQGWPLTGAALQQLQEHGAHLDQLDLCVPASASSDLRQQPRQEQLPEAVWPLLLKHNLYGLPSCPR